MGGEETSLGGVKTIGVRTGNLLFVLCNRDEDMGAMEEVLNVGKKWLAGTLQNKEETAHNGYDTR